MTEVRGVPEVVSAILPLAVPAWAPPPVPSLTSATNPKAARDSGISLIGDSPWGTHFCQFYQTREDLLDILVPYFRAGLESNEFCMWITSEPLDAREAESAIRQAMPNVDRYLDSGQLEILPYDEWYTKGGSFDSQRVLDGWLEKLSGAIRKGFDGLRLSGNTFWLEKDDWDDFTDYEAAVNDVIGKYSIMALCTYCLDRCSAHEIIDVIKNHQFALINRQGRWEKIQTEEEKRLGGALRESEARLRRRNAILDGINRVFHEALTSETEEALGRTCLEVAQDVTGSQLGFIGEVNAEGRLDDIALSDLSWAACRMGLPEGARRVPVSLPIHGIYGRVILDGKSFFTNAPASHPDSVGLPEGHPPLTAFLGVPLIQNGKAIGIVAVANREDGYGDEDLATLEALAPAIVEAFMRKRAEAERERLLLAEQAARAQADAAVKVRDEFISIASHELKTPVTSLHGFSRLLLREHERTGSLDPDFAIDAAARINLQSERLARLIQQLLDVSRIEAGKLALSCHETDVCSLVEMVAESIQHAHPHRIFRVRSAAPVMASIDSLRVEQVLVNLLDNAARFCPEGAAVEIEVGMDELGDVTISVRDRGQGIPEEKLGLIFERFYQADTKSGHGGMGIGLYVSRQIVELHGGTITVEQPEDGGSRFVVRLPLSQKSPDI